MVISKNFAYKDQEMHKISTTVSVRNNRAFSSLGVNIMQRVSTNILDSYLVCEELSLIISIQNSYFDFEKKLSINNNKKKCL